MSTCQPILPEHTHTYTNNMSSLFIQNISFTKDISLHHTDNTVNNLIFDKFRIKKIIHLHGDFFLFDQILWMFFTVQQNLL